MTVHHNWGYFCVVLGVAALIATPQLFILMVNDFFAKDEERLRLDYALTPKLLREPWYFALKGRIWRTLLIFKGVLFAVWWFIFTTALIWGGIAMIRQPM